MTDVQDQVDSFQLRTDNALAVAWMAGGDCDYVTGDVPQILGRPAGSVEQFVIDYAEAFS